MQAARRALVYRDTPETFVEAQQASSSSAIPFAAGALLLAVLFVSTAGSVVSTHRQVKQYLSIPTYVGIVPDHVERAVLEQTPLGSSLEQVQGFLQSRSIGYDGNSSCVAAGQNDLTCRLGTRHRLWQLLRETYVVVYHFDEAGRLAGVSARTSKWL